jgi:GAF domain-containing protein
MSSPPIPANEVERLAALRRSGILDTPPEDAFDELTALAAYICRTPISTVTFIDEHRQWFKSRVGMQEAETPREISFCAHAIVGDEPLIVPDASRDGRFAELPNVVSDPMIRFYAGVPLRTREGLALGTLCVIDHQPRRLTDDQLAALRTLARQAQTHIELRRVVGELTASLDRIKILSGLLPMCAWCGRMRTGDQYWQSVTQYLSTHSEAKITHGICDDCARQVTK